MRLPGRQLNAFSCEGRSYKTLSGPRPFFFGPAENPPEQKGALLPLSFSLHPRRAPEPVGTIGANSRYLQGERRPGDAGTGNSARRRPEVKLQGDAEGRREA